MDHLSLISQRDGPREGVEEEKGVTGGGGREMSDWWVASNFIYIRTRIPEPIPRGRSGICTNRMRQPVSRRFDYEAHKSPPSRGVQTRRVSNDEHCGEKADEGYRTIFPRATIEEF